MNEFFQNLKKEALTAKLSQHEKQYMRVALYEAMKNTPAPIQEVSVRAVRSTYVWFSFISSPRFALPVAAVLIMGLGTGTAYASQAALPGDLLYPVKIHVNEAVEVALASTPADKAKTEERIAERRVAEAQTLDAQGRLDATTTREIEDNFNEHASRALALRGEHLVVETSSASTSAKVMNAQHRGGEDRRALRAAALSVASTTPVATSSEAQVPAVLMQNEGDNMSASLQTQKNILNELKQRVDKHGHGKDNSNDHGSQSSNQGN